MEILRTRGWLTQAPSGFREAVLSRCDHIHIRATQSIYEVGDDTGGIYGIAQGSVELHLPSAGGQPTLTFLSGPGLWLGDVAAITGRSRQLSVLAKADTHVLRLSRAEMQRVTLEDPLAWLQFAELLAMNFTLAMRMIAVLRYDSPVQRLSALLLTLAATEPDGQLKAKVSQAELAAMANLSRTTVNAALAELEDTGLVRRAYAAVEIADVAGLQDLTG